MSAGSNRIEMKFTLESIAILCITVLVIVTNALILLVVFKTNVLRRSINKYFFISLTAADLLIGLLVTPFSLWTSMFDKWIYGDKFCHVEAYLATIFWTVSVYSMAWLAIDHYVAIRKPERYDAVMTPMRCICWITFVWILALSFCCPPLFGVQRARYYKEAYLCIIDWNLQKAYFITAGTLIIVPPIAGLAYMNLYIFTSSYEQRRISFEKSSDIDQSSRPQNYFLNFLVGIVYLLAWTPWCTLQLTEAIHEGPGIMAPVTMHFCFMWFAISNSFWKFLIYVIFGQDFRVGLKQLFSKAFCR